MRNYDFMTTEDKDKIRNIKNAINYRVEKHCKDYLSPYELEKVCEVIDINKQYKVIATPNKKFFENLVYGGYTSYSDDTGKDLITRHRVFKILGTLKVGYKRKDSIIYPTRVLTDRCVVCVQDLTTGCDNGFVWESRCVLYIYIKKSEIDKEEC